MSDTFEYRGRTYPEIVREGRATRWIEPVALRFCQGKGLDIGAGSYPLPGAVVVDPALGPWDAANLPPAPEGGWDYIYSSHTLEHLADWVGALDLWIGQLRTDGCLFLYLPDYSMPYWRPWHNRKHRHVMDREVLADFMSDRGMKPWFASGVDLNYSFSVVGWRESL